MPKRAIGKITIRRLNISHYQTAGFAVGNRPSYCALCQDETQGSPEPAMSVAEHRHTMHPADPAPLGEVVLAPATLTGRSESQSAEAMADSVAETYAVTTDGDNPTTASQALRHLRAMFPEHPLSMRVAALNALMRR
jgi:hypothetical protein